MVDGAAHLDRPEAGQIGPDRVSGWSKFVQPENQNDSKYPWV